MGFRAASALAVGKVIALAFGPAGTALFGQAMNLYTALFNIPGDAIARAMVREGASSRQSGEADRAETAAMTASVMIIVLLVLQALVSFLIARYTSWFEPFQSASGITTYLLGFALVGTGAFTASYFLIWGKTQFQAQAASFMSLGGLLGVLAARAAGFDFFYCLMGFLCGQAIGSFGLLLYRSAEIPLFFKKDFWDFSLARTMLLFAMAVAASGLVNQVAVYSLVHWAIDHIGAEKVGLWMAMNRLADSFNIPILAVANSILLPTLAGLSANLPGLREFLRPIFRQSLIGLGIGMLLLWLCYPLLLHLLYSREFQADPALLPWQIVGDFFRSSTCVFAVLMLAMGHTRFYFWLESGSALFTLAGSWLLFPRFGFACLFITHALRYFLYWLAIVYRYRKIFF